MNINDLLFYMKCGEEIEVYIDGKSYFLQPNYEIVKKDCDNNPAYPFTIIYDSCDYERPKKIFEGSAEDIIDYVFENKYTFRNNMDKFKFVG